MDIMAILGALGGLLGGGSKQARPGPYDLAEPWAKLLLGKGSAGLYASPWGQYFQQGMQDYLHPLQSSTFAQMSNAAGDWLQRATMSQEKQLGERGLEHGGYAQSQISNQSLPYIQALLSAMNQARQQGAQVMNPPGQIQPQYPPMQQGMDLTGLGQMLAQATYKPQTAATGQYPGGTASDYLLGTVPGPYGMPIPVPKVNTKTYKPYG
jgi:hypothetical protein